MTFDGRRNSKPTIGIYFAYASDPREPWITPNRPVQLIFNDCCDQGFGNFIYYSKTEDDKAFGEFSILQPT